MGVAGVQFLLDGNSLGAEDTAGPYSASWNTATVSNGTHVLTARARDTGGNTTTSATITVTVSNAAPSGLVLAMGFNEGAGTSVTDFSGSGQRGNDVEHDVVNQRQVWRRAVVQWHEQSGQHCRFQFAGSDHRHDAGGLGQSHLDQRLARM